MALIDSLGQLIVDHWAYPDEGFGAELRQWQIIPVDILEGLAADAWTAGPVGAFVAAGVHVERLASILGRVDLVVLEFPKFRDGRGFTLARNLRERYGFKGDIRAIGHLLPDQFAALIQSGFSTIVTPPEHPPEQWSRTALSVASRQKPLLQRLLRERAISETEP